MIVGRPMEASASLSRQSKLADAVDAAHDEGTIHDDIKLANIFITKRGHAKIVDYGLAQVTSLKQEPGKHRGPGRKPLPR
jgi:eukaryotic-like serine/threonine-protein kinase